MSRWASIHPLTNRTSTQPEDRGKCYEFPPVTTWPHNRHIGFEASNTVHPILRRSVISPPPDFAWNSNVSNLSLSAHETRTESVINPDIYSTQSLRDAWLASWKKQPFMVITHSSQNDCPIDASLSVFCALPLSRNKITRSSPTVFNTGNYSSAHCIFITSTEV